MTDTELLKEICELIGWENVLMFDGERVFSDWDSMDSMDDGDLLFGHDVLMSSRRVLWEKGKIDVRRCGAGWYALDEQERRIGEVYLTELDCILAALESLRPKERYMVQPNKDIEPIGWLYEDGKYIGSLSDYSTAVRIAAALNAAEKDGTK